jgi:two-component system response regulator HydG
MTIVKSVRKAAEKQQLLAENRSLRNEIKLLTRREDIPLLVDHFLGVYCAKNNRPRLEAPREVLSVLTDYSWPGNVRELENVIERAVVLCRGDKVTVDDLPDVVRQGESAEPSTITFSVGTPLDEVERRLIRETLRHAKGDKSVAAQLLGISTRTIYRKLGELE